MLCKNKKIKDLDDDRQAVVFAMQIDPEVFEKERDPAAFAKLTEESQAVVQEENDDHNNGIKKDWVKVVFHMSRMEKSKYSYYSRKTQFSFPRVLWLHKDSSLADVHHAAFAAFRYPFDESSRKMKDEGEEEDGKVRTVHVFEGTHKNVHCRGGRHAEENEGLIVKQLIEEAGKVLGKGGDENKG